MTKKNKNEELILDGTKIQWHMDRVAKWERGERIAPVTIDMALTRACNYGCHFCYAMLQENDRSVINKEIITNFLEDSDEIGVKAVSFVSDGESTISPAFIDGVKVGNSLGISMAVGTNGFVLTKSKLEEVMPHLTYIRINISAGEKKRYAELFEEYFLKSFSSRLAEYTNPEIDVINKEKINEKTEVKITNITENYRPNLIVLGHNNILENKTLSTIKSKYN